MSSYILVLGTYKSREDHKAFIKSCSSLFDSLSSLGVSNKTYLKPNTDPEQLGINMQVGLLVESSNTSSKRQLEKFISDNKLTYTLVPQEGWEEVNDVTPLPIWVKVKALINNVFSDYYYAEDSTLVISIYRLEKSIEDNKLTEFYKAMTAVLSKVTLPEDKMAMLKEKLFLFNIYYFEL